MDLDESSRPVRLGLTLCLILSVTAFSPVLVRGQTGIVVPPGFNVDLFHSGLSSPTSMTWGPDGNLYISQLGGEIVRLVIGTNGSPIGSALVGKTSSDFLGLVFVGNDLFVSYTGNVAELVLVNGTVSSTHVVLSGLPHGRHENDEIIYGKDGFLYMGIGSTGDRTNGDDPRSATIVRFKPDGSNFTVFAKGLRNPYGLAFDKDGNLFATDNGPDAPAAPDELNYITQGGNYGFPNYFGTPPEGSGTIGPAAILQTHSSSDGFAFYDAAKFPAAYVGNAFIAQWGASSGDTSVGMRIVRVPFQKTEHGFTGQEIIFATGLDHPIDIVDDRKGGLLVADYGSGTIYQISYASNASIPQSNSATTRTGNQNLALPSMLGNSPLDFLLLIIAFGILLIFLRRRAKQHRLRILVSSAESVVGC